MPKGKFVVRLTEGSGIFRRWKTMTEDGRWVDGCTRETARFEKRDQAYDHEDQCFAQAALGPMAQYRLRKRINAVREW